MSTDQSSVEFRDVDGWPGYRVDSAGNVWSCRTRGGGGDARAAFASTYHKLKPLRKKRGYLYVRLSDRSRTSRFYIHRLVLIAFCGPCPPGMEACHAPDYDPANNRLSNLRWGTRGDNMADSLAQGRRLRGSACPAAKLTEADVQTIRSSYIPYVVSMPYLAKQYAVDYALIWRIIHKQVWTHVR